MKIIGFVCSNCNLSAADAARAMHLHYPADIRVRRVECTRQVDEILIAQTFKEKVG